MNTSSAFGFFHIGFGQCLQSSSCNWCRSSCSLRGLEVFLRRGFLGTSTSHDLWKRKEDLLLASSGFREASATGLATLFMLRQFFSWMLRFTIFSEKHPFPSSQWIISWFLKIFIFRLSLWLSQKEKNFLCISTYLSMYQSSYYAYIHTCVCTCIFACIFACMHFLATFTASLTMKCPFVTTCQDMFVWHYIPWDW